MRESGHVAAKTKCLRLVTIIFYIVTADMEHILTMYVTVYGRTEKPNSVAFTTRTLSKTFMQSNQCIMTLLKVKNCLRTYLKFIIAQLGAGLVAANMPGKSK